MPFGQASIASSSDDRLDDVAIVLQLRSIMSWLFDGNEIKAGRAFFRILFKAFGDDLRRAERRSLFQRLEGGDVDRALLYLQNQRPLVDGKPHDLGRLYNAVIMTIFSMPLPEETRLRHIRCFDTHVASLANGIRRARASKKK